MTRNQVLELSYLLHARERKDGLWKRHPPDVRLMSQRQIAGSMYMNRLLLLLLVHVLLIAVMIHFTQNMGCYLM